MQCLRFFNSEMYYTPKEMELLLDALKMSSVADRLLFFEECLRLRRRERHLWGDTPLAKLFTDESEWHLLKAKAALQQFVLALADAVKTRKPPLNPVAIFERFDEDSDGRLSFTQLQKAVEAMHLGFSPADLAVVVRLADKSNDGSVTFEEYLETFQIKLDASLNDVDLDFEEDKVKRWQCNNCTYMNFATDNQCAVCGLGWSGRREIPPNKWNCDPLQGGCSYDNSNSQFYCEVCNKSRPDLSNIRF
jgi:hypothetical protein